ncbi:hypothetical protein [Corynebacterium lizhenjunii]|uniref:hypothetical protein n=1 Tax=Corynebacterium lizhenjunii TaxID=2709394 RepID=UPI0013EC0765|nr:hypothetical protein [Corynebacterium lizhenjunii]
MKNNMPQYLATFGFIVSVIAMGITFFTTEESKLENTNWLIVIAAALLICIINACFIWAFARIILNMRQHFPKKETSPGR